MAQGHQDDPERTELLATRSPLMETSSFSSIVTGYKR